MKPVTRRKAAGAPRSGGPRVGSLGRDSLGHGSPGHGSPGRAAGGLGRGGGALLTSATVSRLADQAASIALVLVVIARTRDPRLAGLVVAAFTVPTLVTGPVLGAYLDRLRAKRALFLGNQVVLAAALTGVLLLAGHAPGLALIGLGLFAGLTAPVLTGGFSSLVPLVVPPASLPRANALDAASYNVAGLGGPALVAAVASAAGAGTALSVVAAIAAFGLLLVLAAPMPVTPSPAGVQSAGAQSAGAQSAGAQSAGPESGGPESAGAQSASPSGPAASVPGAPGSAAPAPGTPATVEPLPGLPVSLRAAVADGLRLLRDIPLLRTTTVATTLGQLTQGLLPVTLPLLAVRLGHGTSAGGWLLTALSAGGLAGALASDRLLARRTPRGVLIWAMAGFGVCLAGMAITPDFALALGLAILGGIAEGPILAATLTVRQRCVPPGRYAQTVATAASLKTGSYALGAAATGLLAGTLTARQLMLVVAAGQFLALVPLLRPGLGRARPSSAGYLARRSTSM